MSKKKSIKDLEQAARRAGWSAKPTKKGTLWLAPNGKGKVLVHRSGGSDHRAIENTRQQFRRNGLDI